MWWVTLSIPHVEISVIKGFMIVPPWDTVLHQGCVQTQDCHCCPSGSALGQHYKCVRDFPHSRWPQEVCPAKLQGKEEGVKNRHAFPWRIHCPRNVLEVIWEGKAMTVQTNTIFIFKHGQDYIFALMNTLDWKHKYLIFMLLWVFISWNASQGRRWTRLDKPSFVNGLVICFLLLRKHVGSQETAALQGILLSSCAASSRRHSPFTKCYDWGHVFRFRRN